MFKIHFIFRWIFIRLAVGGDEGDFSNPRNQFLDAYGISSTGAVVVRPDGYIGWRQPMAHENKEELEQVLTDALSTILFR